MFRSFVFHRVYYSICLILALLVTSTAVSQANMPLIQPSLVKDINTATLSSSPLSITPYNEGFFFTADNGRHGRELWFSDGTETGTRMVKDIVPGTEGSIPSRLTTIGNRLFFTVNESRTYENELWVSDGTANGTYLVAPIKLGPFYATLTNFTDLNGELFFTALDKNNNLCLWKSTGIPGDITLIATLTPSGISGWTEMIAIEDILYIVARSEGGSQLWKSDGGPAGTTVLKHFEDIGFATVSKDEVLSFIPSSNDPIWPFSPRELTNVNGMLFFRGYDEAHGHELWISDGTSEGTRMVVDATAGVISNFPKELTVIGDKLFYVGINYATERGIWSSDGTPEGTREIRSFPRPEEPPEELTVVGNLLFFSANDDETGYDRELWKSDGTIEGTGMVKEIVPGSTGAFPQRLTASNGALFFSVYDSTSQIDEHLWRSDGTQEGTYLVGSGIEAQYLSDIDGTLFFAGQISQHNNLELWRSDGTAAGTRQVKDINTSSQDSFPLSFTRVDDSVFFTAFDTVTGRELWHTDGTKQGTELVRDIQEGIDDGLHWFTEMVDVGGTLLFSTINLSGLPELCRSDGTSGGTRCIFEFEQSDITLEHMTVFDDQLYFISSGNSTLWRSDGTASGTVPIKQFDHIAHMANINNTLWLASADGSSTLGLWRSDGTAAGTLKVGDIQLGDEIYYAGFAAIGDDILFAGNDGTTGIELWKSDGTNEGTTLVKDIRTGEQSGSPEHFIQVGEQVFFIAADSEQGRKLWVTDGTEAGTQSLKDITFDIELIDPLTLLATLDGRLFFLASVEAQYGLWVSDGTVVGTQLVAELQQPENPVISTWLSAIDTMLFFAAPDSEGRQVLWQSDGTPEGTKPVHYGLLGQSPSYVYTPDSLVLLNDILLLSAADERSGQELWSIPSYAGVAQTVLVPPLFGVPPADEVDIPIRYMNVGRMTATDVRLTVTMDSALTYISDASEIMPAIDGERMVWDLPDMGYLDSAAWNLRVRVPEAPYGTRYRVTVEIASAEENHHAVPQRIEMEVMVARQTALPIIGR